MLWKQTLKYVQILYEAPFECGQVKTSEKYNHLFIPAKYCIIQYKFVKMEIRHICVLLNLGERPGKRPTLCYEHQWLKLFGRRCCLCLRGIGSPVKGKRCSVSRFSSTAITCLPCFFHYSDKESRRTVMLSKYYFVSFLFI